MTDSEKLQMSLEELDLITLYHGIQGIDELRYQFDSVVTSVTTDFAVATNYVPRYYLRGIH